MLAAQHDDDEVEKLIINSVLSACKNTDKSILKLLSHWIEY